jgi:hypothetical protein
MLERALQLALAIYRLTELFPEGEVLIGQMRQVANQVLAELVLGQQEEAVRQIKVLLSYFQIAQAQKWTKQINFVILTREYKELLNKIDLTKKQVSSGQIQERAKRERLNQRQEKIFEYIKKNNSVKIKELSILFPQLTPRTIRNDLNDMVRRGILFRQGKGRGSFYEINKEIYKLKKK